jgi:hypothetical protein
VAELWIVLFMCFMIRMILPMALTMLLLLPERWDDSMILTASVYVCFYNSSMVASMTHLWATIRGISLPETKYHLKYLKRILSVCRRGTYGLISQSNQKSVQQTQATAMKNAASDWQQLA